MQEHVNIVINIVMQSCHYGQKLTICTVVEMNDNDRVLFY